MGAEVPERGGIGRGGGPDLRRKGRGEGLAPSRGPYSQNQRDSSIPLRGAHDVIPGNRESSMFWYFVVFTALLMLSLVEGGVRSRWPGYACGVILALMAGLRYETGFDWADYERHFILSPPFGATNIYASITTITVEPGYELLTRVLRTLGADFQIMIFICGVFSVWALVRLTARFSPLIGVVLLWYYGFLFLPGPLATMRQTLSVAFVYLAIVDLNDKRWARAAAWSAIALSLHTFSLIFILIELGRWWRPTLRAAAGTALMGFALSTAGNNLFVSIADFVAAAAGAGFLADKMQVYSSFAGANISPLSVALVLWHLGFIWIVRRKDKKEDYIISAALASAFWIILLHSLFAPLPILWNRFMLVCFPLEAIALCRLYCVELSNFEKRMQAVALAAIGSALALVYTLLNEQSLVYEPYQNVVVTWVRGPYGDGRGRYEYIRQLNDRIFQVQRVR